MASNQSSASSWSAASNVASSGNAVGSAGIFASVASAKTARIFSSRWIGIVLPRRLPSVAFVAEPRPVFSKSAFLPRIVNSSVPYCCSYSAARMPWASRMMGMVSALAAFGLIVPP